MATTVANPADMNIAPARAGGAQAPNRAAPTGQASSAPAAGADSSGLSMAGVQGVMSQPAVKKSMPAIMALLTLAVFIIAYSWVQQPLTEPCIQGFQMRTDRRPLKPLLQQTSVPL